MTVSKIKNYALNFYLEISIDYRYNYKYLNHEKKNYRKFKLNTFISLARKFSMNKV